MISEVDLYAFRPIIDSDKLTSEIFKVGIICTISGFGHCISSVCVCFVFCCCCCCCFFFFFFFFFGGGVLYLLVVEKFVYEAALQRYKENIFQKRANQKSIFIPQRHFAMESIKQIWFPQVICYSNIL